MKTLMKQIIVDKELKMPVFKIPNSKLFKGLNGIGLKSTSVEK